MKTRAKTLRILLSGSLKNRESSEITAFVAMSGNILDQIQDVLFKTFLSSILGISVFLSLYELWTQGLPITELYHTRSFIGVTYALLCLIALRFTQSNRPAMIRFQIALLLPLLTVALASSGGLIDTAMMWIMSLPFIAQIYGGRIFSSLLTLGTFCSVGLLSLLHYYPELSPFLPHLEVSFLQSTLYAVLAVLVAGAHVLIQALKQRRIQIVESALFHIQSSKSTVSTVREMAGAVAHQMNTPLSTYYLAVEQVRSQLTADQAKDPEIDTILQRMDNSITRINQINRSLLMVTDHCDPTSYSKVDLRKSVNTAIEAFRNSSHMERPDINFIDNNYSELVIAADGTIAQFLWRSLSAVEEQMRLNSDSANESLVKFQIDLADAGTHARLTLSARLIDRTFSSETSTSLTLLGAHMLGPSVSIHTARNEPNHIQLLLTFKKASTTVS